MKHIALAVLFALGSVSTVFAAGEVGAGASTSAGAGGTAAGATSAAAGAAAGTAAATAAVANTAKVRVTTAPIPFFMMFFILLSP